ncbi:hypothetical protein, partial [Bacteroides nordii]|uniref:hypothetical protein n=1 Tax=Bacteroides nordii TaxID=291645 RepID=UPI003AF4D605
YTGIFLLKKEENTPARVYNNVNIKFMDKKRYFIDKVRNFATLYKQEHIYDRSNRCCSAKSCG